MSEKAVDCTAAEGTGCHMVKQDNMIQQEPALFRVIERNRGQIMEIILRLLWNAGIYPKEMQKLKWEDMDFENREIVLPDRRVPMDEALYDCLCDRHERYLQSRGWPEYVVITDGGRSHMNHISIYRAVRNALDQGGLTELSPSDLQESFIIRQLQTHDWPYVVRISGISIRTLYTNYSEYLPARLKSPQAEVEEDRLWSLIQEEGPTPAGLALWMTWQLGMSLKEIAALTWYQVDLDTACILLADRVVPMDDTLEVWLKELEANGVAAGDSHVLLTPRAGTPFDPVRLGVVARQALIRGGMEDISAESLLRKNSSRRKRAGDEQILRYVEEKGTIDRNTVMELLNISKASAYTLLRRLTEQGELVLIGARYYRTGTVVPPEEHYRVIREYLKREKGAYRKELATVLQVEIRSCSWILRGLVEEGKLLKDGQRYYLPDSEQ